MTELDLWCEHSCVSQHSPPPACGNNPNMRKKGKNLTMFHFWQNQETNIKFL